MKTIIMNLSALICIIFSQLIPLTSSAGVGPGGGNGGLGVVRKDVNNIARVFILDFVDNGFWRDAKLALLPIEGGTYCKTGGEWGSCQEFGKIKAGLFYSRSVIIREVYIKTGSELKKVLFRDSVNPSIFDQLQLKSNSSNDFMFGKKLDCGLQVSCYSEEVLVAIHTANQLVYSDYELNPSEEPKNYSMPCPNCVSASDKFIQYLLSLNWELSDEQLKYHYDENSSASGPRIVLAERIGKNVKVSRQWWKLGSVDTKPLDLINKVGLLYHEGHYAWTEVQGDTNSDRARQLTELVFLRDYYDCYFKFGSTCKSIYENKLMLIPVHAKPSDKIKTIYDLNSTSYIEIKKPIPFAQGMCASLMFDPKAKAGIVFSQYGYKDAELGSQKFDEVISTERTYINGVICLNKNYPDSAGFTFNSKGTKFLIKDVYKQASKDFNTAPYASFSLVDSSNNLSGMSIHAPFDEGNGSVSIADFNKMYGHIIEIHP